MDKHKIIGKREFIQHTSKYIKWVEEEDSQLIITHYNKPELVLHKIKSKSFRDLRGSVIVKVHGDINEPIFPGYDEW
jgi:hypothetical protein